MILNKLSKNIYVINLKHRTDRLTHIQQELNRIGCTDYKLVEAVNGKDYENNTRLKAGALGLLLTYYKIYKKWSYEKSGTILLIEDDCVFDKDFNELSRLFIDNVPENWDMMYFGGNHNRHTGINTTTVVNNYCIKMSYTFTTHCILLKDYVFDELISMLVDYEYEVDVALTVLQKKYNAYCSRKMLATQLHGVSDIENTFVNYDYFIKD